MQPETRYARSGDLHIAYQVFGEDASIYRGVQRGMEASPFPGVIGVREERVHEFQKYVLDKTRGPVGLPVRDGDGVAAR